MTQKFPGCWPSAVPEGGPNRRRKLSPAYSRGQGGTMRSRLSTRPLSLSNNSTQLSCPIIKLRSRTCLLSR